MTINIKNIKNTSRNNNERGFTFILVSFLIVVIAIFASFAIDVGHALQEQRRIHIAADAGTLGGTSLFLDPGVTAIDITNFARTLANENGLKDSELTAVETGVWAEPDFTASTDMGVVNAVRITATRSVDTFFSRIIGVNSLLPSVASIAARGFPTENSCVAPFGIEDDVVAGRNFGDVLTINRDSPGNWGKLDVGGNMSSGPNFEAAMLNPSCATPVPVPSTVSPGTGFAGIINAFTALIGQRITFSVVDGFGSGNSDPVTVLGFVTVEIISTHGNGNGWTADLMFVEEYTGSGIGGPGGGVLSSSRDLVL